MYAENRSFPSKCSQHVFVLEISHNSAGCLVERKGRSLNHTVYHTLTLEIPTRPFNYAMMSQIIPASTLILSVSSYDLLCSQVCDTCVIGLPSALLSTLLVRSRLKAFRPSRLSF